jgi:hypothetical protein
MIHGFGRVRRDRVCVMVVLLLRRKDFDCDGENNDDGWAKKKTRRQSAHKERSDENPKQLPKKLVPAPASGSFV